MLLHDEYPPASLLAHSSSYSPPSHLPSWLEHARHFVDVFSFVGHVFPALAGPDEVEGVVFEGHVQRVRHLKLGVRNPLLLRQLRRSFDLLM